MLKRLAIVGLLVLGLSCGAWSQVPRNGSDQNQESQQRQNEAQTVQPIAPAFNARVGAAEQKQDANSKPSGYPWRELYAPANIPNWVLAGLAGWAGLMALKTLRAIERQTRYTRRSAEAFINKDRSRLFVRGEISEDFLAGFFAENKGPSPAKVTYGFAGCEILDPNERLPEVPDYTAGGDPWVFARTDWILPGKECWIGNYDAGYIDEERNPDLFNDVFNRKLKVWFYGVVRYSDSISQRGHEVRFCYGMGVRDDNTLFILPDGPEAYRKEK